MGAASLRQHVPQWIDEMRRTGLRSPDSGACAVATAMELWTWTVDRLRRDAADPSKPASATYAAPLAEAIGWLMSARAFVLDATSGDDAFRLDVCHAYTAHACGEVGRICAQMVFGSLRHPAWDTDAGACYSARDLDALEEYVPGLTSTARAYSDVIEADGSHRDKAGPCVRLAGVEDFVRLRAKLDGCLAGAHAAAARVADAMRSQ